MHPDVEIINCEQNSPEWFQARLGLATASHADDIIAQIGPRGGIPKGRQTLLYKLAGEIITGTPAEQYTNADMERGHVMEPEARAAYELVTDADLRQVGFLKRGRAGASPDSMVLFGGKAEGMVEIKTKKPHILIPVLVADEIPAEHVDQMQFQMWIAELEWVDLVCYWPGMPLFIKRCFRDAKRIALIERSTEVFLNDLDALVERLRRRAA